MSSPEPSNQGTEAESWGPIRYEDAVSWRQRIWPREAVRMRTDGVQKVWQALDNPPAAVAKHEAKAKKSREKLQKSIDRQEKRSVKVKKALVRVGVAAASVGMLVTLSPAISLATSLVTGGVWTGSWYVWHQGILKNWRKVDDKRVEVAAEKKRTRLREPLHDFTKGKGRWFWWTPRFSRIFVSTMALVASPPGWITEMTSKLLDSERYRPKKHRYVSELNKAEKAKKPHIKEVESLIEDAKVGTPRRIADNASPSVDAYEAAEAQSLPPQRPQRRSNADNSDQSRPM